MSLKKLGFVAITPAKVVDQDDLNSIGGYSKETINRLGGMTVGALAGTVVGGAAGATQGKRYARSGSGKIYSSVMNVVNRTAKGHGGGRPGF